MERRATWMTCHAPVRTCGAVVAVTAGHPAPTLGEPVPPSQRGTRGFASGAIGSSQSKTVTGSREGNMSY